MSNFGEIHENLPVGLTNKIKEYLEWVQTTITQSAAVELNDLFYELERTVYNLAMNNWSTREDLLSHLDALEMGILSQAGWKHTSSTPDFVWRWTKEIDGKIYMCLKGEALRIQAALDSELT